MSLESAKAFLKKMQEDDEFAKSFFSCSEPEAKKTFIKDNGYEFTKEEIEEAQQGIDISGGSCCGKTCENDHKQGCKLIPSRYGNIWTS